MEKGNSMERNMRVDTAIANNEGGHVSKLVKLLTLVAVVAMILTPTMMRAQADKEAVFVPKNGDEIKTWTVKRSFDIDGMDKQITFTLKRTVTSEPKAEFYIYPKAEEGDHSTWEEGITVAGPTEAYPVGFFTVRATGKFYKATPPTKTYEKVEKPGTGWKRGVNVIRSK
jgi:hypothetical protein